MKTRFLISKDFLIEEMIFTVNYNIKEGEINIVCIDMADQIVNNFCSTALIRHNNVLYTLNEYFTELIRVENS